LKLETNWSACLALRQAIEKYVCIKVLYHNLSSSCVRNITKHLCSQMLYTHLHLKINQREKLALVLLYGLGLLFGGPNTCLYKQNAFSEVRNSLRVFLCYSHYLSRTKSFVINLLLCKVKLPFKELFLGTKKNKISKRSTVDAKECNAS